MTEAELQRRIQIDWSFHGDRLWRNNNGSARTIDGRFITFGLCPGSSDLIGFRRITITPDMVGKTFAQFAAVEVKSKPYRPTKEQKSFVELVNENGGHGRIAYSIAESK